MVAKYDIDKILADSTDLCLIDVRTPAEYSDGHIPGAHNLPIFSNTERAHVGTIYKNEGAEKALKVGLEYVGPKMRSIIEQVCQLNTQEKLAIHCWRGGKRSESIGWLLDFYGMEVTTIKGGYKAYRTHMHEFLFKTPFNLTILGGRTGSAKTAILHELESLGEQVLDLEFLARHKGSAFGWIGEGEQPTTEQFENNLFEVLRHFDGSRRIWIENESKSIGRVYIPDGFWNKMKEAPLVHLEVPLDQRISHLVGLYAGEEDRAALIHSFEKIERRLGGQRLKDAVTAIQSGDYSEAARLALTYYDKTYDYNLKNNSAPSITIIDTKGQRIEEIALGLHKMSTQSVLDN